MKTYRKFFGRCLILVLLGIMYACASSQPPPTTERETAPSPAEQQMRAVAAEQRATPGTFRAEAPTSLPVRFQSPAYAVKGSEEFGTTAGEEDQFSVKVGADISSRTGPVPLRDILKRLALLKNMNISWASDVDQYASVDVDIRAEDDFFNAIENLLRQRDYFHVVQGNTIVVKYKETRKFHVAMPFTASNYASGVGGDVLGSQGGANIKGRMEITSDGNTFDIWENIRTNLDKVLNIWEETKVETAPLPVTAETGDGETAQAEKKAAAAAALSRPAQSSKGYYTIDRPIGLITVTAPRPLLEKVESYLNNLKTELYKQISIEAKILEVMVSDETRTGIDWEQLLSNSAFDFNMSFGNIDATNPFGDNRVFTLGAKGFTLFLNAIKKQGRTKVLANPKLSVMNGQPALINVGENVTYIDSVTSTVDEGVITYSVKTSSVMSGLGLSVIPTLMENDDVILSLTPITSQLEEPIEYRTFGGQNQVGLPRVNIREMTTLVRIKNGEMLVVGGLIDSTDDKDESAVPLLSKLPLVNWLFKNDVELNNRTELIILLQPKVISPVI